MASYESRRNVEVRFAQTHPPLPKESDPEEMHLAYKKQIWTPEQRAQFAQEAIASNERAVLDADREPSREELQTIQELLTAAQAFWSKLGVHEPVARADQFVPVQPSTIQARVATTPELHDAYQAFVQNSHVYFPPYADEEKRLQVLSHELSHLAAKQVLQIESLEGKHEGVVLNSQAKFRQRREGNRFAAKALGDFWKLRDRGLEGYHEAVMELIACQVRHEWCDAKGIPENSPIRESITSITSLGPATRILEAVMEEYITHHPGVQLHELKNQVYLDARNGTYLFIKRLHAWSPASIQPLVQMGTSYPSMRDAAYALVSDTLGDAIEEEGEKK